MITVPLNELTASQLAAAIRRGETTCEAVAQSCLDRIQSRDPTVQAWEYIDPDRVLDAARALDRGERKGALMGVPFGVKDIIDTASLPTQYGSPIYKNHQPKADAACVALSCKAGALMMGKTVTTEFANRHPAKTHHPLDPARTPGGSSSGSAASVGDFMVPLAIGTQTTSSTIKPGSFCGVFAFRPTFGDLSCAGVKQSSAFMDTLGLYARSVEDVSLFRDVLAGTDPSPIVKADRPRIGFCRTHNWRILEPTTQRLLEEAAFVLQKAGAAVSDVTLPPEFASLGDVHRTISSFEFTRNYTWEIENHWNEISDTLRNGRLQHGLSIKFEEYVMARSHAERCQTTLDRIFANYDALLSSPVSGEAPFGLADTGNSSLCAMWTVLHVPAMTLPVFRGPGGLPIGALLIARRNEDRRLFSVAEWVYRCLTS